MKFRENWDFFELFEEILIDFVDSSEFDELEEVIETKVNIRHCFQEWGEAPPELK